MWVFDVEFGIDLPSKQCSCGQEMEGDGFDLQEGLFWNGIHPDLMFSVAKEDYEFVKEWLCNNEYMKKQESQEDEYVVDDENNIERRFSIGIVTVLSECDFDNSEGVYDWSFVRKHRNVILQNYELFLPCTRTINAVPKSLYELIRLVAFFKTSYIEEQYVGNCISEDALLDYNEMTILLEEIYKNDIYEAPVFLEEGIELDDWRVGKYSFLIMFSRSCASLFLKEANHILESFD